MIKMVEDWAAGGTLNCDFTVTLVAPGILSVSEMMNVGAAASRLVGGIANAKFSGTVTGGDIEVERVKDTSGPNFPGPSVVLKTMVKLLTAALLFWTQNTVEFNPNSVEENTLGLFWLPQQLNELRLKNALGYDRVTVSPFESENCVVVPS